MTAHITPERLSKIKVSAEKAAGSNDPGTDADYIATMSPDVTLALVDLLEFGHEAETKIRHLHGPDGDPETYSLSTCGVCTTWEGKAVRWPCPTIRALDSTQETA